MVVRDLLKASDVEFYREVVKDAIRERKHLMREHLKMSVYEQSFKKCQNLWEDNETIRVVFNQEIGEIAAYLLGSKPIRIWHDQALVKEAGGREMTLS